MKILSTSGWDAYELLDSGGGKRLERFGKYRLARPDPQAIWKQKLSHDDWDNVNALFDEKAKQWVKKDMSDPWIVPYKNLRFQARLTPFKHTGIFPEQSINWNFLQEKIAESVARSSESNPNVLNLFGYTGAASLVCASAGAAVTHVDASKPAIGWARENQKLSNLEDKPIRWILDDCVKFVKREIKRGVKYDGIIMDPPVYGHGPGGEVWDFNKSFPELLKFCRQVLSEKPLFVIVNAYAISSSALMLQNVLSDYFSDLGGTMEVGELALEEKISKRLLSTGIYARLEW